MFSARVLVMPALVLLSTAAPQSVRSLSVTATTATGTQPGEFSVNANGGATYTMDLEVPPGTQGVQPKLSIWYVSQNPNGLLGQGFTLQGLSSITRCQASLKLDHYNGGIGFDGRDRYCLDGQRLVKISDDGRDYGAAGSIYHTENETWTKVSAVGQCGTGPCSFTAINKDGWTLEFGVSDSGVPLFNASEIAAWQIKSSTDLNGNRITVSYRFDASTLQNLPVEILYTENRGAGIAATRKVTFEYETRSQQIPRYAGGYSFKLKDRLKRIRTWFDGVAVLEYNLSYYTSSGTRADLLASVQKCTPQAQCFPATTFTYQEETNTVIPPNSSSADGTLQSGWCTESNALIGWADFNGDGTPDIHCDTPSGTHSVLLSDGEELQKPNANSDGRLLTNWCAGSGFTASWMDFNGDAKADLACDGTDGSHRVLLSDGVSLDSPPGAADSLLLSNWCGGSSSYAQWGNFDADGRADLLCRSADGYLRVQVSTGNDLASPNSHGDGRVNSNAWCTASGASMFWADFNGDAMSDAHCASASGTQQVLLSNGSELIAPNADSSGTVKTSWCGGGRVGSADLNGDGLLDSTCDSGGGVHSVLLSTGTSLVSPNSNSDGRMDTPSSWCTGSGSVSAWDDFNGDGMSDLQCRDGGGRFTVLLSTGTNVRAAGSSSDGTLRTDWCKSGTPDWIDFNADALGDMSCSFSGTQQVLVHAAGAPDLVSKISDGIGMTVTLAYAPLSDGDVYTAGSAAVYPTLDIRSPLYVVSHYILGDGRGSQYAFRYQYKGARTDIEEHRWMGFEEVRLTQETIGRTIVTTYAQEYPIISFPTLVTVLDASGRTLATTRYTPLTLSPYTNVWEVLTASETASTYTNGKADYTQTKTYQYDAYGNVKYVADVSPPYYEVYTCVKYQSSADSWRIGYPAEQKTTRTSQACLDFLSASASVWNAATDLRWSRTEYDGRMNVAAQKAWDDGNGAFLTVSRTFDAAGAMTSNSDAGGNTTTYTWDDTSTYPETVVSPPLAGGRLLTTRFTFHRAFAKPATVTDPNGNVFATDIDGFGRITALRGPDPGAASGDADVTLQTHAYGQDSTGRFVEVRRRQTWTDGDPANWFYAREYYDGLSRTFLTRQRSARSTDVLVETLYDSAGREWKSAVPHYSDATANYVITDYDALDRPITVTQPDNTREKTEYLQGTIQVRTIDAYGTSIARTTVDTNDPRQLTLKSVAPNGGIISGTFDPLGQPLSTVYPTGRTTTMTWDSLGRPVKRVDGNSGTTTWSYGTDSLLHSTTNGAGGVVTFAYDALNRPTRRTLTAAAGTEVYTYEYDDNALANGLGQLTAVSGPDYREEYAYSRYAVVSVEQLTIDGRVYIDKADYDPAQRVTLRTFPDGSQLRSIWFVDDTLNTQDLKDGGGDFHNYATYTSYDSLRQPESLVLGNGLRADYTYYPIASGMARPRTMAIARQSAAGSPLLSNSYEWDVLDELTSVQRARAGEEPETETYARDNMGWITTTTSPSVELTYRYDLAGNITKQHGITYRYASASDRLQESDQSATFGHDGAGNLSSKQSGGSIWRYQHDASSRLVSVLLDDRLLAAHVYDNDDNRIRRVDSSGNISTYLAKDVDVYQSGSSILLTKYVQGVSGPVAAVTSTYTPQALASRLRRQKLELDPDRYSNRSPRGLALWALAMLRQVTPTTDLAFAVAALFALLPAGVVLRQTRYTRRHPLFSSFVPFLMCGMVLLGAPGLRADLGSGSGYPTVGKLYFHGDQVESTILVTDANGNESSSITYTPFGRVDANRSSGPNDFRPKFSTKERDDETGLDYFGARHYDSVLGRFLEPDPQEQFASAYVYGGNDPVSMIDPDGQFAALVAAVIAGAVMGAYFAGAAVNHNNYNPAQWDWRSGRTLAGIFAGAVFGAASGSLGVFIGESVGAAAGIAADIVLSGSENAAFTALGGGSGKQVIQSFAIGAASAVVLMGAFAGVSAALARIASSGSRLARRGERAVLDEAADEAGAAGPCSSFPAGETVVMANETLTPIGSIRTGDVVVAYDTDADRRGDFDVMGTFRRESDRLTRITTLNGTIIEATPTHGFFVFGIGWREATELRAGMWLTNDRGEPVPIQSVETRRLPHGLTVHNLSVDEAHTYYISDARVLVKNYLCKALKAKFAARKNYRPSWKSDRRATLEAKQSVGNFIRSSAKPHKLYPKGLKVLIGKKKPRWITAFAIDHAVPYKKLVELSVRSGKEITEPMFRDIYNDLKNLSLQHMKENASHTHEMKGEEAETKGIKIMKRYNAW
jgi:RHS repeat-associated protein